MNQWGRRVDRVRDDQVLLLQSVKERIDCKTRKGMMSSKMSPALRRG